MTNINVFSKKILCIFKTTSVPNYFSKKFEVILSCPEESPKILLSSLLLISPLPTKILRKKPCCCLFVSTIFFTETLCKSPKIVLPLYAILTRRKSGLEMLYPRLIVPVFNSWFVSTVITTYFSTKRICRTFD